MATQRRSWSAKAPLRAAGLALLTAGILGATAYGEPEANPTANVQTKTKPGANSGAGEEFLRSRIELSAARAFAQQKSRLEFEILKARLKAKQAEIELREAEIRIAELTPDLAILEKLEAAVPMRFAQETPLEDVLKYIKQASAGPNDQGIPIYVDPEGLHRAEKTLNSTVTIDVQGVPLRTSLRLVLKQLGLTYVVEGGMLTIR